MDNQNKLVDPNNANLLQAQKDPNFNNLVSFLKTGQNPAVNVDSTSAITTKDYSSASTINPPKVTQNNTKTNTLASVASQTAEGAQMDYDTAQKNQLTPRELEIQKYSKLTTDLAGRANETKTLQEGQDVTGKTKAVNDINNKILTTTRSYDKQLREIEKNTRGALQGGVNIELQRVQKMRDEQLADLGIQKAVALGDLDTANKIVETTIAAKYEPIEQQLNATERLINLYANDMSESEKFEAQNKLQAQRDTINQYQSLQSALIQDANQTGQSSIASEAVRLDPTSPDFLKKLSSLQSKVVKTSGGAFDGLTTGQASMLNSIANAYRKSPLVLASNRTPVLSNAIKDVRTNPKDAALQLNLAYSYIQALDTYQSAVREGELSLVNSIDSKVGQISNWAQQITNGQIVRPEVIKQIADAAESIVGVINTGAKRAEQDFASQASVVGLGDVWNKYTSGFDKTYDIGTQNVNAPLKSGFTGQTASGISYTIE